MSSIYHGHLTVSIFGQSHAPAIGVTVDGLPAGEEVDLEELQAFLNRRAPGTGSWSTTRKEADRPEILAGLDKGRTCGAPLGDGAKGLKKILAQKGVPWAGTFRCRGYDTYGPFGKLGGIAKGHPNARDLDRAAAFLQRLREA